MSRPSQGRLDMFINSIERHDTRPPVRPLNIFVTADPVLPVPPRLYGGIERIIALLVDGLVRRSHEVTLFAHADSTAAGRLVAYPRAGGRGWVESALHGAVIAREALRRRPDVVQSFGRLAYLAPILPSPIPKVMSYQRRVTRKTVQRALGLAHGTLRFTGCSRHVIDPVADLGQWDVVYNAVSTGTFCFAPTVPNDAPLVFLGRIEHIKGTHLAIDVARRTGRRLLIAGNIPAGPEHELYFRERIAPHVNGDTVDYVGPVDDAEKSRLLGGAAALLMPVLWDEPFGIVMAEALACGTPVIGLRRGAVPEVVDDGRTGFVCDDVDGMVESVRRVSQIDRVDCRAAAEHRFSQSALVDAYESLYDAATRPADVPALVDSGRSDP